MEENGDDGMLVSSTSRQTQMVEDNGKDGNFGMYENTELPAAHTSHDSDDSQNSHSSPKKALLAVLCEAFAQGERVALPGLGSFSVVAHDAHMGRNPRTGESIAIPARRRVHFKLAKGLRLLLNS